MKKITNNFKLLVLFIIIVVCCVGCNDVSNETELEYVNNELIADRMYNEAKNSADNSLLGNSNCVISKEDKNTDDA